MNHFAKSIYGPVSPSLTFVLRKHLSYENSTGICVLYARQSDRQASPLFEQFEAAGRIGSILLYDSNRLSKATTIAASVDWLGADLKVLTSSSVDLIIAFHLTKPKRRRLCRRDHVGRLGAERFGWARRPACRLASQPSEIDRKNSKQYRTGNNSQRFPCPHVLRTGVHCDSRATPDSGARYFELTDMNVC